MSMCVSHPRVRFVWYEAREGDEHTCKGPRSLGGLWEFIAFKPVRPRREAPS